MLHLNKHRLFHALPKRVRCDRQMFKEIIEEEFNPLLPKMKDGFNVYMGSNKTERFCILKENEKIVFAVNADVGTFVTFNSGRESVTTIHVTAKFDTATKGIAQKAYRLLAEKNGDSYIMGDCEQTEDSEGMWKNWVSNPVKYGWSDGFIYNTETKEVIRSDNYSKYWGEEEMYKLYRPVVKK